MDQELDYLPEILIELKSKQVFSCPKNYFERNISRTVTNMDLILFKDLGLSRNNPFKIPDNYFKSNVEKTLELFPLNQNISPNNYHIPSDYFAQFSERLMQRIKSVESQAPVIKYNFKRQWIISIAAMFVVMLSIFLYRLENKTTMHEFNLSQIDDDTLFEYIATNEVDMTSFNEVLDELNFTEINLPMDELDDTSLNELLETY